MARSEPRAIFGVHGCTPYSRSTGLPYGELQIVKSSSLKLEGELIDLMGGSNKYPWASEEGTISSEMTLSVGEMPNFLYELFLGAAPTEGTAEASGNISTLTDKYGGTIVDVTNGIASVYLLAGSAANLKFGKYVVVGRGTATFDVYLLSGVDAGRGTNTSFLSDSMMVASAVAFTASVASVPALGLAFAQVGTPAFTANDTATFEVRPVNTDYRTVTIGGTSDQNFPEFGALVYSQRRGNQNMLELDVFRCKGAGMPIPFEMGVWGGYEIKVKCLFDETLGGIFKMRHVEAV